MSLKHWWNDTDSLISKNSQQNLSQCHFVQHMSDDRNQGPTTRDRQLTPKP